MHQSSRCGMRGKQRRLARDESKRPLVGACRVFPFLLTVAVEAPADSRAAELFSLASPAKRELVLALSALATVREQPAAVTRHAAHAARLVVRLHTYAKLFMLSGGIGCAGGAAVKSLSSLGDMRDLVD